MPAKYDTIGKNYNLTRKADKLLTKNFLRHLAPEATGCYLDIGCGTGSYTIEFQRRGYSFIGVDPSERMLEVARRRSNAIDWRLGSAESTGLQPNRVDGITGSLTIHHWTDLAAGFRELSSVLRPGGRIVIFTSTPRQMRGYWLNHYFPTMLAVSIKQMPSLARVKTAMEDAGLEVTETEKYFIQPDLADQFLYCGKHEPELYFRETIRRGISSFSSLSNRAEVKRGLTQLRADIDSGEVQNIVGAYENETGDYLYVVGKKTDG